jgi:hypothetical protein
MTTPPHPTVLECRFCLSAFSRKEKRIIRDMCFRRSSVPPTEQHVSTCHLGLDCPPVSEAVWRLKFRKNRIALFFLFLENYGSLIAL